MFRDVVAQLSAVKGNSSRLDDRFDAMEYCFDVIFNAVMKRFDDQDAKNQPAPQASASSSTRLQTQDARSLIPSRTPLWTTAPREQSPRVQESRPPIPTVIQVREASLKPEEPVFTTIQVLPKPAGSTAQDLVIQDASYNEPLSVKPETCKSCPAYLDFPTPVSLVSSVHPSPSPVVGRLCYSANDTNRHSLAIATAVTGFLLKKVIANMHRPPPAPNLYCGYPTYRSLIY